jgi:hypothetical protein
MDDYSITSLQESRNEWCARLINTLTPLINEGFKSIFNEAWSLCEENGELEKYLMTFQNFIARIPKWNDNIIDTETKRIVEKSNCGYLTDLISCVHIIQLKSLTCMRVGNKQKLININIPDLNQFIHKVYINAARKLYKNIYLYEKNITPLQIQKHNREIELIIREEILNSIRENIPVEDILKVYLDESVEDDIQVEEKEEIISTDPIEEDDEVNNVADENNEVAVSDEVTGETLEIEPLDNKGLKFDDIDRAIGEDHVIEEINAPKTNDRLQQISNERHEARKLEELEYNDEDEDESKIIIGEKIDLEDMDVQNLDKPKELNKIPLGLEEIEILT